MKNKAYVKHPITKEEAQKIRSEGFMIIDLKFKPESIADGDIVVDGKPKRKPRKKKEEE